VRTRVPILLAAVAMTAVAACGGDDDDSAADTTSSSSGAGTTPDTSAPANLTLTSSAFTDDQPIPVEFTCDGQNTSPPLAWSGVPDTTEQLAIIVDDPDAPSGTFVHWVIWGINPDDGSLATGQVPPSATEGNNGAGSSGYIGPCPPSGVHHYEFNLFALSAAPDVEAGANAEQLRDAIADITLAEAQLVGTYTRQ
jgi:Raf kinase inhibitor-like YbhB/YbcL family protein